MERTRTHRWILLPLLLLALAFLIAGCTGDQGGQVSDDDSATPVEQVDTATPETTDEETASTPDATEDDQQDADVESATPTIEEDADDEAGYPVSVTSSDGVELTIEERPERIISLSPGATETFFAIGAGEQLVAVDMFSDYPEEAADLPQVDAYQPDPEAIIDLDPDLVFVIYDADGIVEVLEGLDVQVLYLEAPTSIDGLIEQIEILGEVTGNLTEADELTASLEERVDAVEDQVGDIDERPSVYHELDDFFFTVGPESFVGDLYNILGAQNIAEGAMGEYPQLSEEIILEENPEVIVLPSYGESGAAESVRERPGWDGIDAVANDRVYEIDGNIVSRPGPRIVDALEQLAEMLYPEEFANLDDFTVSQVDFQVETSIS